VHSQGRDVNSAPTEYEEMVFTRPLGPASHSVQDMSATSGPESSICPDANKNYAELKFCLLFQMGVKRGLSKVKGD
jgi:hypothetical protein